MNERQIRALQWEGDKVIALGGGLYFRNRKASKTYIIRKTINKKPRDITLGRSSTLSLKLARLEAMKFSLEKDVSTITVSNLLSQYLKDAVYPASKVPKQVEGYLNHIDIAMGRRRLLIRQ